MPDEQTTQTDTTGTPTNPPVENTDQPVSEYDKALELVKRREEVTKVELEVLAEKKKFAANELLAGTGGGHVKPSPPKELTDEEYADKFMRGEANPLKEDGIEL